MVTMVTLTTKASPYHLEELLCVRKASSHLPNFTFPTSGWGAGKILPCRKVAKTVEGRTSRGIRGSLEEVTSPSEIQPISIDTAENAEIRWNLRKRRREIAFSKEKTKLSVSLSLKEIVNDFLLMNGKKPHKRPTKRPRLVQKQVDTIFPGMELHDVTPNKYKVK